ncbi:MAG: hypothetical protein HKN25_07470 [Pyrinomonadaceae bacterium]|nr:hypothetical protein [Pyrinomonadaceae bacterium]
METFNVPLQPILVFLVVLARIGGLVTFAPFWAHRSISFNVRVVIAGVLSLTLTPFLLPRLQNIPADIFPLTLILLGELLIGLLLGFVGRIIFLGFEMGAHFLGAQMGFALAGVIDPNTNAQTTTFGILAQMLSIIVLLAANGHHWFLIAAVKSYETTAPGSFSLSPQLVDMLVRMSADALIVGVSLAAPAIIVLVVVEFGLEFFGRTAPQFQVFILGFPLKIGIGLWIVGASLYFIPTAFRDVLSTLYVGLDRVLGSI